MVRGTLEGRRFSASTGATPANSPSAWSAAPSRSQRGAERLGSRPWSRSWNGGSISSWSAIPASPNGFLSWGGSNLGPRCSLEGILIWYVSWLPVAARRRPAGSETPSRLRKGDFLIARSRSCFLATPESAAGKPPLPPEGRFPNRPVPLLFPCCSGIGGWETAAPTGRGRAAPDFGRAISQSPGPAPVPLLLRNRRLGNRRSHRKGDFLIARSRSCFLATPESAAGKPPLPPETTPESAAGKPLAPTGRAIS